MSASGYTPISLYYSTTAAAVPVNTNLANGELAINITDGKLYYKNNSGVVTLLAAAAAATGTVSSVAQSFTGGLISVAGSPITTSGTLALTVAGTSGGIPYFSSSSTWATSAALSASALVIGGGAGAAPSTTTTGTGVVTALGVNTGTAGAFVVNGGALGTPSSGTVTNLTGTASININGTVGATTANTGAFTTLSATGVATFSAGTAALPAITTTGDTNTGIYFPAADTIAFTEGGAEAMRIDSSGNVGIGSTSLATARLYVTNTITDTVNSESAVYSIMTANNASGSNIKIGNRSSVLTGASFAGTGVLNAYRADITYSLASAFTGSLQGFRTSLANSGAGAVSSVYGFTSTNPANTGGGSITNYYGFAQDDVTTATSVYGFLGSVASGTNKYNLYMSGTADNYLAGKTGIGGTASVGQILRVGGSLTGSTSSRQVIANGVVASDVTARADSFYSVPQTAASAFTLGILSHFHAVQSTIGATSSVTTQIGFEAESSLTGATNNYGFYGNIASGTGRYNFYAAGTADNYFAGNVGIGVPSPTVNAGRVSLDMKGSTGRADVFLGTGAADGTGVIVGAIQWNAGLSATAGENRIATILGITEGATASNRGGVISFSTKANGSTTITEAMRIDSSGNVGIGTTSPLGKLQIDVSGVAFAVGFGGNLDNYYTSGSSGFHAFRQGSTERMRIDSSGNVGIGTTSPAVKLAINSTDAILLPKGTTAQQPTGVAGYMRFNTTTTQFEGYNGTVWASVGGAAISNDTTTSTNLYPLFANATSGSATTIYTGNTKYLYKPSTGELTAPAVISSNGISINSTTVSASYTIATGNNGFSVGPITVASGQSVTVSSGQRWLVL